MKRKRKSKKILIKEIQYDSRTFEYRYYEKEKAEKLINSTKTEPGTYKAEKAEWYISAEYKIKRIVKNKHFEKIVYIILSISLGWFLKNCFDNWVSQSS